MSILTNANIMVTGGTGTFGHAFVQQALVDGARRIVVFSRDELKQSEMAKQFSDDRMRFMLGDVRDAARLERAMRGVEYVVHAAAMKQVPACEQHPWEAEETNSIGSRHVAQAAIKAHVRKAVLLSSDKAANPNTHYGATKLMAEHHFTNGNVDAAGTVTRLIATRYGNVLGSRGSVVPVWQKQIAAGAVPTVTDARATRFWMTISDAVWLVMTALRDGRGGEIFIPKIGAASITTLLDAVKVGYRSEGITVADGYQETGLRRSEKLHELLITQDEARDTYTCSDYYLIEPDRTWEFLPPPPHPKVREGFVYSSNENAWQHTVEDLATMIIHSTHGE